MGYCLFRGPSDTIQNKKNKPPLWYFLIQVRLFLARATVGTSLYVWLRQLVSAFFLGQAILD